jgi:hypothetical protein
LRPFRLPENEISTGKSRLSRDALDKAIDFIARKINSVAEMVV